jgi:hypothetical protein
MSEVAKRLAELILPNEERAPRPKFDLDARIVPTARKASAPAVPAADVARRNNPLNVRPVLTGFTAHAVELNSVRPVVDLPTVWDVHVYPFARLGSGFSSYTLPDPTLTLEQYHGAAFAFDEACALEEEPTGTIRPRRTLPPGDLAASVLEAYAVVVFDPATDDLASIVRGQFSAASTSVSWAGLPALGPVTALASGFSLVPDGNGGTVQAPFSAQFDIAPPSLNVAPATGGGAIFHLAFLSDGSSWSLYATRLV